MPARSCRHVAPVGTLLLLVAIVSACATSPRAAAPTPAAQPQRSTDISSGTDVVNAMYARYHDTWYHSLTFHQTTTIWLPNGGQLVQTWYEAGKMPGRLRIDTDSAGSGVIYAGDSVFSFASGRLARADTGMNDLLILGFDVYAQPVATTLAILQRRGFDVNRFHRTTWEGRPTYVVGAAEGDTTSKQFWVDAERLLFVRLLDSRSTSQGARQEDIRFLNYVQHGGGWVAEEVMMYSDGKPRLHEVYADVKTNVPIDDAYFDPRQWSTAPKWYTR